MSHSGGSSNQPSNEVPHTSSISSSSFSNGVMRGTSPTQSATPSATLAHPLSPPPPTTTTTITNRAEANVPTPVQNGPSHDIGYTNQESADSRMGPPATTQEDARDAGEDENEEMIPMAQGPAPPQCTCGAVIWDRTPPRNPFEPVMDSPEQRAEGTISKFFDRGPDSF